MKWFWKCVASEDQRFSVENRRGLLYEMVPWLKQIYQVLRNVFHLDSAPNYAARTTPKFLRKNMSHPSATAATVSAAA
jgi:hypothetical protein